TSFTGSDATFLAARAQEAGASWFGVDGDSWKVGIDSPASAKVADYWNDLVTSGLAKNDVPWQPAWFKAFQDGTYVTWISAAWGQAVLKTQTPALAGKWAVAPVPRWDANTPTGSFWGGSANAVPKNAPNPSGAAQFAGWL